jgi:phage tail-like protein
VSSYLHYLPAVLRQGSFLGQFLRAFEAVLSGLDLSQLPEGELPLSPAERADLAAADREGLSLPAGFATAGQIAGLEQLLGSVQAFFDPDEVPEDFLPWLAQWVATSLRDDWSVETQRQFIRSIVPLYNVRGTVFGMAEVLRLSGDPAQIVEPPDRTHYFKVIVTVQDGDPHEINRKLRRVRAIIDREKPAHTCYSLETIAPAMQINNLGPAARPEFGPGIIVGTNTLLGTETD